MGFPVRVFWLFIWLFATGLLATGLLAGCSGVAWAQSGSLLGTSKVPASPSNDHSVKTPTAAPRVPVRRADSAKVAKTPVVPPHGPLHPHKPLGPAAKSSVPPVQAQAPSTPPIAAAHGPQAAPAGKLPDPEKPEGAAPKLPRFASLRSDDVNMRAGPGTRYRIDWVYKRRDLPVEIEREFDVWRWVRDPDGIQGWVHQATLMGRRSFIVEKADATMRSEASDTASAVAVLKPGVIGRIRSCEASSEWCSVQTGSYRGYLRRTQFWGVLPGEPINP